ncbi:MAG: hypothetical protein EPN93_00815 [Spirochaetes bacterium]|nr:MAG: hypothetical protein EPN93_00815 [Spirochaetota bacterium]
MKEKAFMVFMACAVAACALFAGTVPGHAAGMSVGVNTWYSTWDMAPSSELSYDSSLMYGPVLGVDWGKKWSITCVLLTADYKATLDVMPGFSIPIHLRRYDSDTTLNYSILKWLKVFGGIKYMRYDTRETGESVPVFGSADSRHYSYGPGLGIGLTLPITDSLFALVNLSGMYLKGKESTKLDDSNLTETGINTTASIAYYAASISTTFALGGRYQYFKSDTDLAGAVTNELTFYGITFSAVYHFGLGGEE